MNEYTIRVGQSGQVSWSMRSNRQRQTKEQRSAWKSKLTLGKAQWQTEKKKKMQDVEFQQIGLVGTKGLVDG